MDLKFYKYKKADISDIGLLAETRITVLRAANKLDASADMSDVYNNTCEYYKTALGDGTHITYLVFDEDTVIGAGSICYYSVMPTCCNPTGKKAYVMNMYTAPEYRRKGIAFQLLDTLVKEAVERGVTDIGLEATDMGRPLYEKYGFEDAGAEMRLGRKVI